MTSIFSIDINCDLGEGETIQDCENDSHLMPFISSCNIACGEHAGNPLTIRESLKNAGKFNLKIGAHPGYPDKESFGRNNSTMSIPQLEQSLGSQLDLFLEIAEQENCKVHHIKLHGALYNDVEVNPGLASSIANFIQQNFPSLKVLALGGGDFANECEKIDLEVISEGFMDRRYNDSGKLTPRQEPGSVIENQKECIQQAVALATQKSITTDNGLAITPIVKTICLHSDTHGAIDIAKELVVAFKNAGIVIQ